MAVRLHVFEDVLDFAIGPDHEGSPGNAHYLFAIHVLFFHHAKGIGDLLFGVGEQREGQILLFLEFLLRFWRIRGYAKQHDARLLNLSICVAEPASFYRSTRGVRPWIEKQNDRLAAQVFQRDLDAVLVLQSEVGSLIIDLHAKFSAKAQLVSWLELPPASFVQNFTPENSSACRRRVDGRGSAWFRNSAGDSAGRASTDHAGNAEGASQEGLRATRHRHRPVGEER